MEAGDRGRRREHQQRAYELQIMGGLHGMMRWTVYGLIGVGLMHRFWPLFRKQTLALKGFIVSSATMSGLVIGADDYLLKYESAQRDAENTVRREARIALASRGIIATEPEIQRWRAERAAERRVAERQAALDRAAAAAERERAVDAAAEATATSVEHAAVEQSAVLAALEETKAAPEEPPRAPGPEGK